MKLILTLLTTLLLAPLRAAEPDWVLEGEAPWNARACQGECVFHDQLWILGGWLRSKEAPIQDVWSSSNGRDWKLVTKNAPWIHSDLPMSLAFNGQIWQMGGWKDGPDGGQDASNQVWSTTNGAEWQQVTPAAPWSARLAGGLVEHKGRMWLLGGSENYYFGDASSLKNDVWSSADGREWKREAVSAGWSPRAYHQNVVLDGRIFVFGGGVSNREKNDVWSSRDGVTWICETDAAPWPARLWFSAAVYRDRIWVLGGWSKRGGSFRDVWHSADGRTWRQLQTKSMWSARYEPSVFVLQNKLWVVGGNASPLSKEVWSLSLPPDWKP